MTSKVTVAVSVAGTQTVDPSSVFSNLKGKLDIFENLEKSK